MKLPGYVTEEIAEFVGERLAVVPTEKKDLTEETVAALEQAKKSLDAGDSISHEEILREFGQ